jgi:hypothetical protein
MSPQEYVDEVKEKLARSAVVGSWSVVNEMVLSDRGHLRVRLCLSNGDFVEAMEFFFLRDAGVVPQRYRYQWMDGGQQVLRRRWDNAPHFPGVDGFPDHVHVEREDNVLPSRMFGIGELVDLLEGEL